MRKASIILPPLVLLIAGAAVYILVVQWTTPEPIVLQAQPLPTSTPTATSSAQTTAPATPITTEVQPPEPAEVSQWQQAADQGVEAWRLDPLEVAKRQSLAYGFVATDHFSLSRPSGQVASGTIEVEATHSGDNYHIELYQPGVQGEDGVWTIRAISAHTH